MAETCSITRCGRPALRYLPVHDRAIYLCVIHKDEWDHSGEFRRAYAQACHLAAEQNERKAQSRVSSGTAYDTAIRRAWLLAMDDFVRRISQEERVARLIAAERGQ